MTSKEDGLKYIYKALHELGLDNKTANLYVLSLQNGPMKVIELAEKLDMNRPNVYKLINRLEDAGLANFSNQQKHSKRFMVESPNVVLEKVKDKKDDTKKTIEKITRSLPILLGQYQQGDLPSKIQVFKGEKQFTEMFEMVLRESGERNDFLGSADDFIDLVTWKKENWFIKEREKRGIFMRSLLLPSKTSDMLSEQDEDQLRETRILRNADRFVTSFQLFGDKVIIWQPKAPLGILIEDEFIVSMLRSIFEELWKISK